MVAKRLKEYLDSNKVKYVAIKHSPAFTALEITESVHISSNNFIKTVMVKIDDKLAMAAVLPADKKLDVSALRNLTKAKDVEIATENEFSSKFSDCEVGAMPPFGALYDMDVYADFTFHKGEEISFNAGTHSEVITMSYKDYEKIVKPTMGTFHLK